jgi:hypothetical protein
MQRGDDPEDDSRNDCDRECGGEHAAIDCDVSETRERRRHEAQQPFLSPHRERDAEYASGECENHVLGDELSDDPPTPGAE